MTAVTWWLRAATENRVILSVGEAGDEESVLFRNVQRQVRLRAGVVTGPYGEVRTALKQPDKSEFGSVAALLLPSAEGGALAIRRRRRERKNRFHSHSLPQSASPAQLP